MKTEEAENARNNIAESIRRLIDRESLPNYARIGLDPEEVNESPTVEDICYYVLLIQDLLRLPKEILDGGIESIIHQISELLLNAEFEDVEEDQVLEALADRLELANQAADEYQRKVDEEVGSEGAAKAWEEVFDINESDDSLALSPHEQIDANVQVRPPNFFIDAAKEKRLILSPPYQRDDVWDIKKSQRLIESILRKIPLPSIILDETEDGELQVVDGKQRLTALLRFTGNHPEAKRIAQLLDERFQTEGQFSLLLTKDYPAFKKLWKQHHNGSLPTREEERNFKLPFALPRSTSPNSLLRDSTFGGKYYSEIKDIKLKAWTTPKRTVSQVLEGGLDYNFAVITFTTASQKTIREVFRLYNVQGQTLNAEEIRNAEFNDLELMRALTVAVGDAKPLEGDSSMAYLETPLIQILPREMQETKVGTASYKRSRIATWIMAIIFQKGEGSTAGISNEFFKQVEMASAAVSPFKDPTEIAKLFEMMSSSFTLVNEHIWPKGFRSQKNSLGAVPLVTVVAAIMAANLYHGDSFTSKCTDDVFERILERAANEWQWPGKMQTNIQWRYTSDRFCGILEEFDVNILDLHREIISRFGMSGVATRFEVASS